MKNHYQTLGVSPSATAEEIKNAYKRLSKRVHPDKNWGDKIFEELFKNVNEAYQVLGNEVERRAYNQKYNHFFFSHAQHSDQPQVIVEKPAAYPPHKKSLLRKFIINGFGSLLLVFFFMGVNAVIFTSEEIHPESSESNLLINKPVNAVLNAPKKIAGNNLKSNYKKQVIIPVNQEPLPFNRALNKGEKDIEIINALIKPEGDELKNEVIKNVSKIVNEPTVKNYWTEKEMMELVEKVKILKASAGNKINCIRLLQSSNSNIKNGLSLASYLQKNNFSIAGRLITSQSSNGIFMEINNNCISITIGFIQ